MGFFDRRSPRKDPPETPAGAPAAEAAAGTAGGVMPQLVKAREHLEANELSAALALYEPVLTSAGDRADVLVTISADLGLNGRFAEIVELVAPRYDAERHGPATGLNLLQAYLALRQADAAQHVLDILFSLQRPELEERLHGFSNAIAELIHSDLLPVDAPGTPDAVPTEQKVNFVSISKPIWFYGLEPLAAEILPSKEGRFRRVAFTQLALLGVPDLGELMQQPEGATARLTRAIPLAFADAFYFSSHYSPIAVIGVMNEKHYVIMGAEWSLENLRQLATTTEGGLDYIFSGALRQVGGDSEVILRLWEVKKMRERKTFTGRWNDLTRDRELAQLQQQVRTFMEWAPEKSGLSYSPPARAGAWADQLGAALSLFLGAKGLLPKSQLAVPAELQASAAAHAADSDVGSLAWLTLTSSARQQQLELHAADSVSLRPTPAVEKARELLGSI